jgi:hypothetical protein
LGKEVFGLAKKAALKPLGLAHVTPLDGQAADILPVAGGILPGVVADMANLGRDAAQGDEDLAL